MKLDQLIEHKSVSIRAVQRADFERSKSEAQSSHARNVGEVAKIHFEQLRA